MSWKCSQVAATEVGVCCLAFGEGEAELRARFPRAELVPAGEAFRDLFAQVVEAVEQEGELGRLGQRLVDGDVIRIHPQRLIDQLRLHRGQPLGLQR